MVKGVNAQGFKVRTAMSSVKYCNSDQLSPDAVEHREITKAA